MRKKEGEMVKKEFEIPKMELMVFDEIVVTNSSCPGHCYDYCPGVCFNVCRDNCLSVG